MSLYKDASLAMIPTAYKDGKLYSIRPTDGSGDFTFSRGSNLAATRVDVNGLIEKGRENLLLQSNQFDTTWTTNNASVTGGQPDKDGGADAWELKNNSGATNTSRVQQLLTASSGVYSFSVYAKAGNVNYLRILSNASSNIPVAWFDLTDGTAYNASNTINTDSEDIGNGWYRCNITFNNSSTGCYLYPTSVAGSTLSGNGEYIYIQDAQLEQGLVATDYIETGATTAQAGILEDLPRLDYSGGASCPALLLEPQRSNQIRQSEYFGGWGGTATRTDNYAISPEGVKNAAMLEANSGVGNGVLFIAQVSSSTLYKGSVYVKSAGATTGKFRFFDGSTGQSTTTTFTPTSEWTRVEVQRTSGSSTTQIRADIFDNDGDLLLYGAQMEAGSYPTSYIPTYGSAVTRSSDKPISSSYNYQAEGILGANVGTIILDCETIGTSTGSNDFHMFGAANNIQNGYLFRANSGTTMDILERNSNVSTAQWSSIGNKQTRNKIGVSYSGADVDVYVNGVAKSLSSGTPQGGGNINGFATSQSNSAGLIIHQILLFPNKLTDSEMASITTL